MTKFKVGDKVTWLKATPRSQGWNGTVLEVSDAGVKVHWVGDRKGREVEQLHLEDIDKVLLAPAE